MKEILYDFFTELGLTDIAIRVSKSDHRFSFKIYSQIFVQEIRRRELIVSHERAREMEKEFYKEYEKFRKENYK